MNGKCKHTLSVPSVLGFKSNEKIPNAFIIGNMVYLIQLD